MSIFLKLLFKHKIRSSPAKFDQNYQVKGMTMIELLVGTVIAFIVITPLMGMVIGLLNDDQRESAKANTEEEIQSALDYIGEDVSQALHIYTKSDIDTTVKTFLPPDGAPVLVFWKRKIVEDAVPVDTSKQPKDCNTTTTPCDDTYVLSLVSYQLLPETDKTSIWCQPSASDKPCPSRIVRYEISDGLKKSDGTYYKKAELTTELQEYAEENITDYNKSFSLSKPLENVTNKANFPANQVLVNYIEEFELDPSSTNDIAKLTIQGNALRRNDAEADCTNNPDSPYCPKSSVQLRGLSGLGN
ncbi:hypothetical protein [Planktothrix mougeotii]|uniref:Prepilin-type N-terminal cleavage/methylation domain-containing protein n=1 Tax=Planktothrix mougeotii LEGE 06226 TaxID=1828728 RepID=A0ABR9UFI4_9CYAN|nr:hypothetical protein [Planktothrix mougeotii]MBE9144586.1 hypothetical protein [Planktothrix mougeotii LEGE 06226]